MENSEAWHLTDRILHEQGKGDPFAAAVRATRMPMIVTDPRQDDNPIVFANDAFLELTGYSRAEVIGRNCRFLQGAGTNPEAVGTLRDAVAARTDAQVDLLNYRKDGTSFNNALYMCPVFGEAGELQFFFASQLDVTERVDAQEALRRREAELGVIFEGARDYAFLTIGPDRRITSFSKGAEAAFGWRADEVIGRSADVLFTPEDRAEGVPEREIATAEAEGCANDERWHQRKDGTHVFMNGSIHPLPRDEQGRDQGFIKIARDETDRRRADERLRESEERLRLAVDAAEVGFWDVDVVNDILIWPPRTKAMFGISADVPVTMQDFYDGLHPDDRETTSEVYASAADPGIRALYDVEYRTVGKEDGIVRWVGAKGRGVFDEAGTCLRVVGTAIDITERKRVEAELLATDARLRELNADLERQIVERGSERAHLWQVSPDLLSVIDMASGRFDRVNPAWSAALGWSSVEIDGQPYERFVHPDDAAASTAAFEQVRAGNPVLRFENRYRAKDGSWRWLSWVAVPEGGKLYSTTRDVTDEKASAEALAIATAERDRMWLTSPDLLVVLDFDGVFRRVNPAWTHVLGFAEEELIGTRVDRLVHPDDVALTEEALAVASDGPIPTVENRYRHKDGSYRWLSWITAPPEAGLIYATGRHVTAEKEREAELEAAQDALRQAQKMEAVGQLTGGIAHDFNNMLAVVIGSLDLLDRRLGEADPRAKRYVDAAADGARRAAQLTQRLLAFSRQQPLKPETVDANKLVRGMSEILRHSLGGDVQLECVLAGGLWRTHADPNQLESVVLNLAINARDAMAEGGRLTIETANCHLDARYVTPHIGVAPGQYVMIAVTDTGAGMTPEVIAKAFDPFFTTKGVGKGTGLGLSQVYGFVKQSGGHVKIYSEPGQGTTIKLYLPRLIGGEPDVDDQAATGEMPLGEQQEVILVVEDEPAVRQLSVDALTELGYRVLEADGASAALRLLDAHPEIALLFTDVVMPEVNGARLAEEARRRRPGMRVLFTTGYTRNAVVHNGVLDAGVELVGKPFTIEELAAKVRQMLDAPVPTDPDGTEP